MRATDESLEPTIDLPPSADAESLRAITLGPRTSARPIDTRVDGETLQDEPMPMRRAPLGAKLLFAMVLGGCMFVLALWGRTYWVQHSVPTGPRAVLAPRPPNAAAAAVAPPPPSPNAAVAAAIPVAAAPPPPADAPPAAPVAVDAPKPTQSTIKLAKKAHVLRVDGKLAKGSTVEVTCGPHLVAVGKQKPRLIDAVCGRTVVVDAQKATVVDDNAPPARGRSSRSPGAAVGAKRKPG